MKLAAPTSSSPGAREESMASDVVPEVARIVAGHTLVRKVGEGAMADVWEAWGPEGTSVALKLLKPERAADPVTVREFLDEAEATSSVDHENVVSILGSGSDEGCYWIRMEFVDGPSLARLLAARGALPYRTAIRIALQVARALAHAHRQGLVHRDVKPDNILLFRDGRARLTDFGIVKDVSTLKGYLLPGRKVGTPAYASPEQCLGKRLSPATDIYSLGATLYHMVVGRSPFGGETRSAIMRRQVNGRLVPPIQARPELPKSLSKLIERMLSKRVTARPDTMDRVISDLEMILAGRVPLAPVRRRV
jgi:serine/threonine-protein kinase